MGRQLAQQYADWWIADLAGRQHGVVAWFQLRAAGISRGLVDFRLAEGRLHIVHRGVYAVGHAAVSGRGRLMAAVLALGPGAVLSHGSAAMLWGLLADWRGAAHVTVPGRGARGRRSGIIVHRVHEIERAELDGIPVTTLPQTLLDLASTTSERTLTRAVERAEAARLLDLGALEPLLATTRPGVRALRATLELYDDAPTRSELERRFLELCRDHDVPRPEVNVWLEGYEVDFLWRSERLIVETDGLEWHGTHAARERDLERDAALALAGFQTQRFTWRLTTQQPSKVARLVLQLLAARR